MRENRFQQRERVRGVVAKIFFRPMHGFAGLNERREMHHSLRLDLGKNLVKQRAVCDVADDQSGRSGKRGAMPMREIIENDGLVTAIQQLRDHHASDVASATRYEYSLYHACDGLVSKEIAVILIRARCPQFDANALAVVAGYCNMQR